jgi:hypothetical protein
VREVIRESAEYKSQEEDTAVTLGGSGDGEMGKSRQIDEWPPSERQQVT